MKYMPEQKYTVYMHADKDDDNVEQKRLQPQ